MILTFLLAAMLAAAPSDNLVETSTTPSHGFEPLTIRVVITNRVVDAREVCLVLDDGVPQRSCWPPTGMVTDKRIKGLPAGNYTIMAEVRDVTGAWYRSSAEQVRVISQYGLPDDVGE